jgi:hypothetical protein
MNNKSRRRREKDILGDEKREWRAKRDREKNRQEEG